MAKTRAELSRELNRLKKRAGVAPRRNPPPARAKHPADLVRKALAAASEFDARSEATYAQARRTPGAAGDRLAREAHGYALLAEELRIKVGGKRAAGRR